MRTLIDVWMKYECEQYICFDLTVWTKCVCACMFGRANS